LKEKVAKKKKAPPNYQNMKCQVKPLDIVPYSVTHTMCSGEYGVSEVYRLVLDDVESYIHCGCEIYYLKNQYVRR
jgi:hypothetical protein